MNKKYYGDEKYYLDAFERLDAVGKNTWNWAAFFFGPCWLAYRKMYAYSLLALIFWGVSGGLLVHILLGLFGNALYYKIVKRRIAQGYHLLKNFQPVSFTCALSFGVLGFVSFLADEFLIREYFQSKESEDSIQTISTFEASSENVGAYLYEFRPKHVASWIADAVICILLAMPWFISKTISYCGIKKSEKIIYQHSRRYEKKENGESYYEETYEEKRMEGISSELKELLSKNFSTVEKLKALNISGRKKPLPTDFGKLKNLSVLNISGTDFDSLPESFGDLKNLEVLNISVCNLKILPEYFGNLENLKVLNISCCDLKMLPESFGNLSNLKALNISGCKISHVPDSIGNLKNLVDLSLEENNLTELPESIGNLANLKQLNLANNKLRKLPKSISKLINLKEIDLRDNPLDEVPKFLKNRSELNIKF